MHLRALSARLALCPAFDNQIVSGLDLLRFFGTQPDHVLRHTLRNQFVRMILAHQFAIGFLDIVWQSTDKVYSALNLGSKFIVDDSLVRLAQGTILVTRIKRDLNGEIVYVADSGIPKKDEDGNVLSRYVRTTPGRILLNESFK